MGSTEKRRKTRWIAAGTMLIYLLIGLEILIMISPFALYFYSVYGPVLNFLFSSPLTSWTAEFFLPHMVFPADPLIIAVSYLQLLLPIGLILFLAAAVPLYYHRFTRRGIAQGWIYSFNRHPQYLALGIAGLGLLLYWPRFIILFFYIIMLFVYYFLARIEENRMVREAGDSYRAYLRRTPMFFPGEPGGKIYQKIFGWIRPKSLGMAVNFLACLALAMAITLGLRAYTVNSLPLATTERMTLLPAFPHPDQKLKDLYQLVRSHQEVDRFLEAQPGINLAYIVPRDFFLMALVTEAAREFPESMIERYPEILEWHKYKFRGGIHKFFKIFSNFIGTIGRKEKELDIERFIFVRVEDEKGRIVKGENVFDVGMRRHPVLLVDVDAFTGEVLAVEDIAPRHKWGRMPMPTF
ncbi:MAG: methyltransferase family protein [Desulfurivibrionaceae bacterium]